MECRAGCGACCIALSISSSIPGMPYGKPAGVRCVQLTDDNLCKLFGKPERPRVCRLYQPSEDLCGQSRQEALIHLTLLERATCSEARPDKAQRKDDSIQGKETSGGTSTRQRRVSFL